MAEQMPEQEMSAEAAPAEAMPQDAPMAIFTALTQIHEALAQSSVPPEALSALEASINSYTQFMEAMGAGGEMEKAAQAPVAAEGQGSKSVPADMPMRKGAVPA